MKYKVVFKQKIKIKEGKTILDGAQQLGIEIPAPCKGKGKCGKCLVRVIEGDIHEPTVKELKELGKKELAQGIRLACQVSVTGGLVVEPL